MQAIDDASSIPWNTLLDGGGKPRCGVVAALLVRAQYPPGLRTLEIAEIVANVPLPRIGRSILSDQQYAHCCSQRLYAPEKSFPGRVPIQKHRDDGGDLPQLVRRVLERFPGRVVVGRAPGTPARRECSQDK